MKKSLITLAVSALFAASAFAGNDNGPTTNNNQTYNQPQGGQGGQGGNGFGGSATAGAAALAGAIATGGNSSATGGQGGSVLGSGNSSNSNKNDNKNTNTNAQGQQQGQAQGQQQTSNSAVKNSGNSSSKSSASTANANNSAQSVTVHGDTVSYAAQERNPVSTAYAPSIAPTAPCMGSTSGGAQGVGFGFSIGSTWTDDNCVLLEQVRATAIVLGDRETAAEMMTSVPAYAAARQRIADRKAGKADSKAAPVTSANYAEVKPAPAAKAGSYTESDPIVRRRLGLPPL